VHENGFWRLRVKPVDAIIIGGGPAGLACAFGMRRLGLSAVILEKAETVASAWRRHYDCLHLHTERAHSGLPGMPMPQSYPIFPSRAQVVEYFESYADRFDLRPAYRANVSRIRRHGAGWLVEADGNSMVSPNVVVATGWADFPYVPTWPGSDEFRGSLVHSSAYRNAAPYRGKRALVVGYGNSGAEIALDLFRSGVDTALSVRGPVQIMPLKLFGVPSATWGIAQRRIPARLADRLNRPLLLLATGRIEKVGLRRAAKGPRRLVEEDGRSPVIDVGTLARIRDGSIKVRGGIDRLASAGVVFSDGRAENFDAIILATGFRPDLRKIAPDLPGVFDATGRPLASGRATSELGLYFCGIIASPAGQLREIGIEALRIAKLAKQRLEAVGATNAASRFD